MKKRTASAEWKGGLKDGEGKFSTGTGTFREVGYAHKDRFEDGTRTNPEELIAAAQAACFSMALSAELGKLNLTPDLIQTQAHLTFEKTDAGFAITQIHLETRGRVPKATQEQFQTAAEAAKKGCPVSRVLKTEITVEAKLETSVHA
jgi:osmotically inducible protein OsmC